MPKRELLKPNRRNHIEKEEYWYVRQELNFQKKKKKKTRSKNPPKDFIRETKDSKLLKKLFQSSQLKKKYIKWHRKALRSVSNRNYYYSMRKHNKLSPPMFMTLYPLNIRSCRISLNFTLHISWTYSNKILH